MWLGMCCRCPASGTKPRNRFAAGRASSGRADISIACRYRCRTPGCLRPSSVASAASRMRLASMTRDPGAGSPVLVSHSAHAETFSNASAAKCLDVDVVRMGVGQSEAMASA